MSHIKINTGAIYSNGKHADQSASNASNAKSTIRNIKSQIDPKILSRNGIAGQFNTIDSQLSQIETKIRKIKSVTEQNIKDYENTDKTLARRINVSVPKIR